MTISTAAKPLILLTMLMFAAPSWATQLVSAPLKNGDYGTGTAVPPTSGVVNTADGVVYVATEASGRSNGLVNWQIGNNFQWRRTGTITFMIKVIRGQFASGGIVGDNNGFGTFRNGQGTFGIGAGPVANGPGPEDDRVVVGWSTWHNNVWYNHTAAEIEYDRWYSIGFAWGGPNFEFEIWVDQELKSSANLPAANLPWGTDFGQNGFNMGLGDNHERGVDPYNSAPGVMFADIRMWNEYRALGDTVAPNRAPTATDDAYQLSENGTLTVDPSGVLGNDTDQDGDTLAAAVASGVAHGSLALNADGSFTYQPDAGYTGTDSFTYTASDGSLQSVATATITIIPVNQAPVAMDDHATATRTILIAVLANDVDADGDVLTLTSVGGATIGTVGIDGNQVRYSVDVFGGLAWAVAQLTELPHGHRTSLLARLRNAERAAADGHFAVAIRDLLHAADALERFSGGDAARAIVLRSRAVAAGALVDEFYYSVSDGRGGTASARVTVSIALQ